MRKQIQKHKEQEDIISYTSNDEKISQCRSESKDFDLYSVTTTTVLNEAPNLE
jgi:hypothetical protein